MRVRRFAAMTLAACAVSTGLLIAPTAASASSVGCPTGYDNPGEVTFAQTLVLPRIQTGINSGAYTTDELRAVFDLIDRNGDGTICVKAVSNLQGNSTKQWSAFYNGQDNHPRN
jgi:hypothetical protein